MEMTAQEKADRALIEQVWRSRHGFGPERELIATDQEWWLFIDILNARQNAAA